MVSLAVANANDISSYIKKPKVREEIISLINEAKDFVLAEGKDKALRVFDGPKGKFVRGELYIIACDFNGTCWDQSPSSSYLAIELANKCENLIPARKSIRLKTSEYNGNQKLHVQYLAQKHYYRSLICQNIWH